VGRTKLNASERFLYHPVFQGEVHPDIVYVIADDVCTLGGTLAALRGYIVNNGGKVCSFTTLAHRDGEWQSLAIRPETCKEVEGLYGVAFNSFWKGEIGYDALCLTETEARVLAAWGKKRPERGDALIHALRNHLLETAGKGLRREGVSSR
jgi:hypothetical protein